MKDTDHDPLLDRLRQLPLHEPSAAPGRDPRRAARAAFADGAAGAGSLRVASRALVPLVLASLVGLDLSWAFSAVIAMNH